MEKDWFCAGIKSKMSAGIASSSRQSERTPTLNNESVHMFMVEYCRAYQKPGEKEKRESNDEAIVRVHRDPSRGQAHDRLPSDLQAMEQSSNCYPRGNADVFGTKRNKRSHFVDDHTSVVKKKKNLKKISFLRIFSKLAILREMVLKSSG